MDINENMKFDNFERVINDITEGDMQVVDSKKITHDMVQKSIQKQFDNNRIMTTGVNLSMLELALNDLEQYMQTSVRGK